MDQYEHIRTAHRVYGQSISEIARITGHSRNTIRKALSETYDGYSLRQHQPFPVLGPFQKIIDVWLNDDRERPRKQRHTARRIYLFFCHFLLMPFPIMKYSIWVVFIRLMLMSLGTEAFLSIPAVWSQDGQRVKKEKN